MTSVVVAVVEVENDFEKSLQINASYDVTKVELRIEVLLILL